MANRKLSAYEIQLVEKHAAVIGAPMYGRRGSQVYTAAQIDAAFNAERAEVKRKQQQAMADDSAYFTSEEFRNEVIEELIAKGATCEQATNRTRDQARLFAEARTLNLM
ncbi:hypothetical protein [Burkholderia phage BCSR5]|nr:hypothetical protein [Burkholderia phage BCSR5]